MKLTPANILSNAWAFYAEDIMVRIDAMQAEEERQMRECMGNHVTRPYGGAIGCAATNAVGRSLEYPCVGRPVAQAQALIAAWPRVRRMVRRRAGAAA